VPSRIGIFAVGFLASSPARVAIKIALGARMDKAAPSFCRIDIFRFERYIAPHTLCRRCLLDYIRVQVSPKPTSCGNVVVGNRYVLRVSFWRRGPCPCTVTSARPWRPSTCPEPMIPKRGTAGSVPDLPPSLPAHQGKDVVDALLDEERVLKRVSIRLLRLATRAATIRRQMRFCKSTSVFS